MNFNLAQENSLETVTNLRCEIEKIKKDKKDKKELQDIIKSQKTRLNLSETEFKNSNKTIESLKIQNFEQAKKN